MKKRILSLLTALCLCLSLLPTTAWAVTGGEHLGHCICGAEHSDIGDHTSKNVITDWKAVSQQSDIEGTGNYYLTDDVTLDNQWKIENGTNITLCLNGHTLTSNNTSSGDTILVEGTLTITDCKTTGKITGTYESDSPSGNHKVLVVSSASGGGTLNLYGGTITGINAGDSGAGGGGGVHNNGIFNMYGGKITGNTAAKGGGVYNYHYSSANTVFNFYGGTIADNTAASFGQDVCNEKNSTINANGGTVKGIVMNNGTITTASTYDGTTFNGKVTNFGTISGGTFKDEVTNSSGATISGGTFKDEVTNNSGATISGGTFKDEVTNNSGATISGGTFKDEVTNNGTISNGKFNGTVINSETISGGTFQTIVNNNIIQFADSDAYDAFVANNPTITGSGYILVSNSTITPYSNRGTELKGCHTTLTWNNITALYGGIIGGCAWDNRSNTLTLTDVYINSLDLSDIDINQNITLVIDGEATINTLSVPDDYAGTIIMQGKNGQNTDSLYSYSEIPLGNSAVTLKDLTATLNDFSAESLVLTDSKLTMYSGSTLSAESITMENSSSITLNNTKIEGSGLNTLLPDGYSINDKGEILDSNGKVVTKITLSAQPTNTPSDSSSNSTSSKKPSYAISLSDTVENGTLSLSRTKAKKGRTVTITVTPDDGYTLKTLSVTDKNGEEIEWTDNGDGTYSFTMPSGKVSVTADFKEISKVTGNDSSFNPVSKDNPFTDVNKSDYYYNAVLWATENGIISGADETHFAPDMSCTRGQLAAFLYRYVQSQGGGFSGAWMFQLPFSDVPEWCYEAVAWCYMNGIVSGYDNGLFGTDDTISREQMVTILYRFAKFMGIDTTQGGMAVREYLDYESISGYAMSAMQWAVNTDIVSGTDGYLMPQADCSRAQIVSMLYRLLNV